MIVIPGFSGFVSDRIGGQIDIMPTLAYLLGIDKEKYASSVMGQNLFAVPHRRSNTVKRGNYCTTNDQVI